MALRSRARNPIGLLHSTLPLLPPLAAFILQWLLWPDLRPFAWFLFYPAVFLSSWMGGRTSGLLATVISATLIWWFFIPYESSFVLATPQSLLSVAIFMGMGGLFTLFHGRLRNVSREAASRSSAHLLLALGQAAQAVQRARTPDEIYGAVGDEVVGLGYHAAVFTLAADREHLELSYLTFQPALLRRAEKFTGISAEAYRFPLVPGTFYERIIAEGQAVFSARLGDYIGEAMPGRARHLAGPVAGILGLDTSSIVAPLRSGAEPHGLLVVFGTGLTEADVPAVTVFANQTAIALDNVRAEEALRRSERLLSEAQRIAHIGSWEHDVATGTLDWSDESHRIFGVEPGMFAGTVEAFLACVHPEDRGKAAPSLADLEAGDRGPTEYRIVRPDGTVRILREESEVIRDADGVPLRHVGSTQDITERMAAESERSRLVAAVEQTGDAVVVTDLAGTIEYVNPAFLRASGYALGDVIGQNPRILQSGRQSVGFYRALWRRLTRGEVWAGRFVNRRTDGELYQVEASISPIRDPGGQVTGYVGVQRDVTELLAARSGLTSQFRERAQVAAALSRLQARDTAEATATEICDELINLAGLDLAAVFTFADRSHASTLAVTGPAGLPVARGRPLPTSRATYLHERATKGPWAEAWVPRPEDGAYGLAMARLGVRAIAYAPIRNDEGLLGVVAAGTFDDMFASHLIDHLPIVGEFAATAGALLGGQLQRGRREDRARTRINTVLADRAFHSVFQPIVDLGSGRTVGFEALTRFADGTPPERMIADAHAAGLGIDLENACLAAALEAAEALPRRAWLSLNASADVVLASIELPGLLAGSSRRIVLELTEHVEIVDHAALRAAVAAFGPLVSLAVDDAGAGFAGLRHIVELAPRFLKLDIGLIRGVDRDPVRQAMVAGLTHFAGRIGCEILAEGIEEPAELAMLRELDVPLGQGYLLGRPEPLPAVSGSPRRSPGSRRPVRVRDLRTDARVGRP